MSLLIGDGGDLVAEAGDLVLDGGLGSAVLVSLFCDAGSDQRPIGERRGFWAEPTVGSLLWLLDREKATAETAAAARDYAARALRWLIEDGIAQGVEVDTSYPRPGFLALEVRIVRGTAQRWADVWSRTSDFSHSFDGGVLRLGVA